MLHSLVNLLITFIVDPNENAHLISLKYPEKRFHVKGKLHQNEKTYSFD